MFRIPALKTAALLIGMGFGAASAATVSVTFDFTALRGSGQTYGQTIGGLSLAVDGARYNNNLSIFGNSRVNWNSFGLGARSGLTDTDPAIDGAGSNEILIFLFSQVVKIEQITFDAIARRSRADGFVNGAYVGTAAVAQTYDASANGYLAALYGIGARTTASSFRISSLTVTYDDLLTPVSLPAAGLLLASGLGMLGVMRRRRQMLPAQA